MTTQDLKKWDALAEQSTLDHHFDFYQRNRLFTYLYVAQEEAANLSASLKGTYQGSLDPISYKVLSIFLPEVNIQNRQSDDYSETLANIVLAKIKNRVADENHSQKKFSVEPNKKEMFSAGLEVAKWSPWYAYPPEKFWCSPPPSLKDPIWTTGIRDIKNAQAKLNENNIKTIFRWAGIPNRFSDDWRNIANQYCFINTIPFKDLIESRTVLTISLYDTIIAYTTMKYHYQNIRPQIYDPRSIYLINVPKHPTYPAGHAAEGADASVILSYYFPANKNEWHQLADEEAATRVWSGVHFPVDLIAGKEIGSKVAQHVLKVFNQKQGQI